MQCSPEVCRESKAQELAKTHLAGEVSNAARSLTPEFIKIHALYAFFTDLSCLTWPEVAIAQL